MNRRFLNQALSFSLLSLLVASVTLPTAWTQVPRAQAVAVPPAALTMRFMDDYGKPYPAQHGVLIVSNQEHIRLKVSLSFRPGAPQMTASHTFVYQGAQFGTKMGVDSFQRAATLSLRVRRQTGSGWKDVPVSVHSAGGNLSEEDAWFTLPLPLAQRRQRATRFFNALLKRPDARLQALTAQEKQSFIDAVVQQTLDNQPGTYDLQSVYSAHEPGFWNGSVQSRPVRLRIIDKGNPYTAFLAHSAKQRQSQESGTQRP